MHSVTLDRSGSPKKRTLSRGISEDESLRNIIKETESSSRRLVRSESRGGTLKRRTDSQSDQDLFMGLPEMLELQASYDEVVQELRGLELEREGLLFQVDVLQDTLEGVEELLAEAQREARQSNMELEREREAKRKLEDMVCSLMREVERLKEEKNTELTLGTNDQDGAPLSINPAEAQRSDTSTNGLPASFSSKGTSDKSCHSNAGSSGEGEDEGMGERVEGSPLIKLQRMASNTHGQMPSLALDSHLSEDGVLRRPCENQIDDGRDQSPERNNDTDSISAYEDASDETPELDRVFPGDTAELPDDADATGKGNLTNNCQADNSEPHSPDSCVLS
ncbi:uncharacterized protein ACJ7VT_011527 isoform 2-T2 [Polymixia lowei]